MNQGMSTSSSGYPKGCFVDDDGFVRDVANPGPGVSCQVTDRTVMLCGPYEEGDGAEVLGEFTYYPTLDALRAVGYAPGINGEAVPVTADSSGRAGGQ
ncbi:hypothetical protein GGD68_006078 [Paraburkholderia fungorum]|uniref:Uncharacterized protein n=1 Tax=Paraburkholderia fungorum TaxID=134537 RepID=A0AAW3V0J6_9BURK|nr:hypothetical protein [Paraburkholderia fungorum]MBB6204343.1 hypothetical protein [Paraburkholderia fungorum]